MFEFVCVCVCVCVCVWTRLLVIKLVQRDDFVQSRFTLLM
jgi:hypothetical protein